MFKYVTKRLIVGFVTLFLLATVTFFMMHAMPGSPFASEKPLPADIVKQMEEQYGLDKPVHEQYFMYMGKAAKGDFGNSTKYTGFSVKEIIGRGLPTTMKLGVTAFLIAVVVGLFLGVISAFSKNKILNGFVMSVSTIGVSVPSFILAVLLMLTFAVKLNWFNVSGAQELKDYVLPAISLAMMPIAYIARLTRSSLVEVLRQDYIVMARSKGLSWPTIIVRHGLKNALLPVVTYLGPLFATLLTGSFVIENIFAIPGIGLEFVKSINNRDFSVIVGITVFYGALIVAANILVDIVAAFIDPRIKLEE